MAKLNTVAVRAMTCLLAGSVAAPAPVGTPPMLSPAEYNHTWAAATVPADWQWGPQSQNPRSVPRHRACTLL